MQKDKPKPDELKDLFETYFPELVPTLKALGKKEGGPGFRVVAIDTPTTKWRDPNA